LRDSIFTNENLSVAVLYCHPNYVESMDRSSVVPAGLVITVRPFPKITKAKEETKQNKETKKGYCRCGSSDRASSCSQGTIP
jgi:hypothetical protein